MKNCQQISAINIHSGTITKDTINKSLDFTDTEIIIDEYSFSDCNRGDKDNLNGGAIYYECSNGELTVHGTIFENCETNEVQFLPLVKIGTTNILIKIWIKLIRINAAIHNAQLNVMNKTIIVMEVN